jgi:hypothetical protein
VVMIIESLDVVVFMSVSLHLLAASTLPRVSWLLGT